VSALDAIHVEHWGSGQPVVMIHGGARGGPVGGAGTFAAQRALADRGYALVLPDRPGHGQSPAGDGREDLELDAVWVAELLGSGAHLVGHSYGAAIAISAAGRRPAAVRSLTLIEPPIFSVAREDPDARRLALQLTDAIGQPDELERILAFVRAAGIPSGVLSPPPHPGQAMAMARGLVAMRDPVTWEARPSLEAIAAAQVPALIVTGGWSPGFEAIGDRLAALLGARRLVIEAGHHLPHLAGGRVDGHGSEFNTALLELIRSAG
jgi:pimeloyl-ACP methyl ester carboxylesterase